MEEKVCDTTGRWTFDLPSQLACKYDKASLLILLLSQQEKKERCTVIHMSTKPDLQTYKLKGIHQYVAIKMIDFCFQQLTALRRKTKIHFLN